MTVEEKALELLAENRVVATGRAERILVAGHTNHYYVEATKQGIECSCPARQELCAHALAAMVKWAERVEELKPPW